MVELRGLRETTNYQSIALVQACVTRAAALCGIAISLAKKDNLFPQASARTSSVRACPFGSHLHLP